MSSRLAYCWDRGLLATPPQFLRNNVHYEVITGSVAYGVSADVSDMDIHGWCIPPKDYVFPHLRGEIEGFGTKGPRFGEFTQHHVKDKDSNTEFDFTIYNVVKFLNLVMMNNPNMIDTMFVPERCVLHITPLGQMVRDRRRTFLHKGAVEKMLGYAHNQLSASDMKKQNVKELLDIKAFEAEHKLIPGTRQEDVLSELGARVVKPGLRSKTFFGLEDVDLEQYSVLFEKMVKKSKRLQSVKKFGYDVKYLYHVVRLVSQCEQILRERDLNLEEDHRRAMMKTVRAGEWHLDDVKKWFTEKEREMIKLRDESKLPEKMDEDAVRLLLVNVLETHYGKFKDYELGRPDESKTVLREIGKLIGPYLD